MKMSIVEIEYKNIRRIRTLKIPFTREDGSFIKNNFIMMANGTGKTTTMTLIKGLLDRSAEKWTVDEVRSYAPKTVDVDDGEFNITVKFDERKYRYFLAFDYRKGTAKIGTSVLPKGYEAGLSLPESIRGIFSPEFVRRFVFDGEQVAKSLDSTSNEAGETIKYLYRLDKLDEILELNSRILMDIQNSEGKIGTDSSLNNLRTRQRKVYMAIEKLRKQRDTLKEDIHALDKKKVALERKRDEIASKYEELSQEKIEIEKAQDQNQHLIETYTAEIIGLIKSPYLLSKEICDRMQNLGSCMTKLKLPKAISKDFFTELAYNTTCVCDRCIGELEKQAILKNAERYLGSDQQAILNVIKSSLINCTYDSRLEDKFEQLWEKRDYAISLDTQHTANEDKLVQEGGKEVEGILNQIKDCEEKITECKVKLKDIESKDEDDFRLTSENNLNKAEKEFKRYEEAITRATRTHNASHKKEIIENLISSIKESVTKRLKEEIVCKANEKLARVITDDHIEIESIDQYIKLKDRDGASEGQTLGIAYCFLGTLFEDAELEFPFIIDSPTGKMDFEKRKAVAEIIPALFNQLIAFVQSAEVERFADQFYDKEDVQYLTIVVSLQGEAEVHEGSEFFDSYQREHKGDDE